MQVSRINQLRKAQDEVDQYLRHSTAHVESYIDALIDLVVEAFVTSPKPVTHPQYRAEMVEVQRCATYLFERLAHYLFVTDRVDDVYQCLHNPLVLSYGIAMALINPHEDRFVAMGRKAVSLGGILTANYARSSDIGDPQAYRAKRDMPPLDIIKGVLVNQFKNDWAIEFDAPQNLRHGQLTCVLWGHVADSEPEWAIRFMLEHEDQLSVLLEGCFHPYQDARRFLTALLRTTLTAKPFIELQRQCPEYFDALLAGSFLPEHIETTLVKYQKFKLSEMPFLEIMSQPHLSQYFLECVKRGTLTHDRLTDLRKAGTLYGLQTDIAVEALKSPGAKKQLAFVRPYYSFIRDPQLTAQQILEKTKDFTGVNQHFDVLDGLLNQPGKRLADSPAALENHTAFILSATRFDAAFYQQVLVTSKILEVCLMKLSDKSRDDNEGLMDFLTEVIKDKKHRQVVARLSYDQVNVLKKVIPELDIALVRAIKWEDPVIKAELLEDALGL
jgi:hypothetical protein